MKEVGYIVLLYTELKESRGVCGKETCTLSLSVLVLSFPVLPMSQDRNLILICVFIWPSIWFFFFLLCGLAYMYVFVLLNSCALGTLLCFLLYGIFNLLVWIFAWFWFLYVVVLVRCSVSPSFSYFFGQWRSTRALWCFAYYGCLCLCSFLIIVNGVFEVFFCDSQNRWILMSGRDQLFLFLFPFILSVYIPVLIRQFLLNYWTLLLDLL